MKKIYAVAFLLMSGLFCSLSAQNSVAVGAGIPVTKPTVSVISTQMVVDTLEPGSWGMPYQCDTAFVYYNLLAPASGFAFGNNSYGEIECAQKYYATGTVSEVLVWYAYKTGTTGTTSAKIYSISPTTKGPMTVLGTSSNTVTTGSILTTPYTAYTFSPPVAVAISFAVASVFPTTAGDTVAVVSTKLGCSTPDSLSWANAAAFGGWDHVKGLFGVNLDLVILPIADVGAGINEYPSSNGLTLMGAYPNPANDFTNIRYNIKEQTNVSIEVFDLNGRVILNSSEQFSAGTHDIKISLKDISVGNYYYTIKTGDAQLTSKFVVAK